MKKYVRKEAKEIINTICNSASARRQSHDVRYADMPTNYGELDPLVKIHILDTIINQASAVFGPYGGIYGELKSIEMMGGQQLTEGGYEKSKDGHSFFNSLELGNKYSQTIMKSIQQMTKYVAGYEGDTSRDGTTSLAIVGCSGARNLLARTIDKDPIPSTIQNKIFDSILYFGSSLIEKHKVPVYDKENTCYTENGFNRALNAIKTTVDANPLFVEPFEKLMQESSDKGYSLINCHLSNPNNIEGLAGLEIKANAGIRFRATNLDTNNSGGFYNHTSYTFVLDGYISSEHRDIYVYHLKNWLKTICSLRDEQGLLFVPGRYDVPLIIITRTPDYLEKVYKQIQQEGITVTSNGQQHTIKPRFMLGNNTESFQVYFDDMLQVFHETRIDLNAINRYIRDNKTTSDEVDPNLGVAPSVKQTELDLKTLFPHIVSRNGKILFSITVPEPNDVYDEDIPDNVEQQAKYVLNGERIFDPSYVLISANYDGQSLSLVPPNADVVSRANEHRNMLLEQKKTLSDYALEDNAIKERLSFFSSMTIKPYISARSKDEYAQMYSIYEDALGVFQSIHKHGVMPGGNIFILKYADELRTSVREEMEHKFAEYPENKRKSYLEFADTVVNSLIDGYWDSLALLTQGDFELVENEFKTNIDKLKEDTLLSYDLVTGTWNNEIVEASRTTADVFASTLTMMKDMLQLKRVKLNTENGEHTQIHLANKELVVCEKYKDINEQ